MDTRTHVLSGTGPRVNIRLSDPNKQSKVIVIGSTGIKEVSLATSNDINFAA